MRAITGFIIAAWASVVCAKLPALSDEAMAQAAQTAAKSAWTDKVSAYQLCLAMDRTAKVYRDDLKAAGKAAPPPGATPPCVDPGPYAAPATPIASKPLEASEAHSPPGPALSPPSTNVPAAATSQQGK